MSPARRKDGEGDLLRELKQIADLPKERVADALRSFITSRQASPARRGRRKGSKTKVATPGVKQAREYLDLICKGMSPADAAEKVASFYNVDAATVSRALDRHHARLLEEELEKLTGDAREHAEEMLSGTVDKFEVAEAHREIDKRIEAMTTRLSESLPAATTGMESEEDIRKAQLEIIDAALLDLSRWATEEARVLSENRPSTRPHGGVVTLDAFSKGLLSRKP